MIFTLRIERERIILETTHLNTMREKENGKREWATGKEGFSVETKLGERFVERIGERICPGQMKSRIINKDEEERVMQRSN